MAFGLKPVDNNSIKDFLAKPLEVARGTIGIGDLANTDLWTADIEDLIKSNPIWANKLTGYNLFRAKAVLKVIVNGMPFHQGRMKIRFVPLWKVLYSQYFEFIHNRNLLQKTQHQGVEFDVKSANATLEIPFVGPTSYLDLSNYNVNTDGANINAGWGRAFLTVISPLATGATSTNNISYSIYLSFEDVELAAPKAESKRGVKFTDVFSHEQEQRSSIRGPGLIGKLANTASAVLNPFTTLADSALSLFGFSKPNTIDPMKPVTIHPTYNFANADGMKQSDVLSLNANATVNTTPEVMGSKVDEMAISHLAQIPALVTSFNVATSNVADDLLFSSPINQLAGVNSTTTGTGGSYQYRDLIPMSYLSRYFKFWRGSIVYTFKIVKTDYHSCRLQFSYQPSTGTFNNVTSAYMLRNIVDIRDTEEVSLTIPFSDSNNYLECSTDEIGGNPYDNGFIQCRLVNELVVPDTVSNNIQVLVYVSAGPDFELMGPRPFWGQPICQAGIGDCEIPGWNDVINAAHVNSAALSIKQLLNVPSLVKSRLTVAQTQAYRVYPHSFQMFTGNTTTGLIDNPFFGCDVMSSLVMGFALYKGGVRWIDILSSPATTIASLVDWQSGGNGFDAMSAVNLLNPATISNDLDSRDSSLTAPSISQRPLVDLIVPYVAKTPSCPVYVGNYAQRAHNLPTGGVAFGVEIQHAVNSIAMFRAAADDFMLSYFINFPPVVTSLTRT
uniref:Picornavirus capsid domain-containing protein n=1 Tax=Reticulitermes speratus picorna-like virus TaxID=3032236 RepID=A0AAT9JFY8_9VIRU